LRALSGRFAAQDEAKECGDPAKGVEEACRRARRGDGGAEVVIDQAVLAVNPRAPGFSAARAAPAFRFFPHRCGRLAVGDNGAQTKTETGKERAAFRVSAVGNFNTVAPFVARRSGVHDLERA